MAMKDYIDTQCGEIPVLLQNAGLIIISPPPPPPNTPPPGGGGDHTPTLTQKTINSTRKGADEPNQNVVAQNKVTQMFCGKGAFRCPTVRPYTNFNFGSFYIFLFSFPIPTHKNACLPWQSVRFWRNGCFLAVWLFIKNYRTGVFV
jgi:hypothetical protein